MIDFLSLFLLIFKIYCYISISLLPFVLYYSFFESTYKPNSTYYHRKEWYHFLKVWWATPAVKKHQKSFSNSISQETNEVIEEPRKLTTFMRSDSQTIYGTDQNGNFLFIKISLREKRLVELCLQLRFSDGRIYQLPDHPLILLCSIPNRKWSAAGLEINVVEPFSTLRITYNGLLRNVIRNDESVEIGDVQHSYFSFLWSAACDPKFFPQESSTSILADALAIEPWRNAKWINLLGFQTGYDQYGMLLGQIIFEKQVPQTFRLTSCRKRTWGPSEVRILHRDLTLFSTDPHGFVFNLTVKSYKGGCRELHNGSIILPNKKVLPIDECDISLPDFLENRIIPGAFRFSFKAGGKQYNCTAFTHVHSVANMKNKETSGYKSKLVKIDYVVNGEDAKGFGLFWYKHKGKGSEIPPYIIRPGRQQLISQQDYVASFSSSECRSEYLAGIKGTSLALLSAINSNKFEIPDGFCVLVTALKEHIKRHPNIRDELKNLNEICCGVKVGDFADICDRVQKVFQSTPLSESLKEKISIELQILKFKNEEDNALVNSKTYCWAVRSSTIYEDLDKIPILRNQTFLDCFSEEDVYKAIVKCWASVYSYPKVQYRKQHGLPIICDMGVIVQHTINSDTSGVLSTIEPKSGDPGVMIITANYGLGVTVVTEMIEPDIAKVYRTWNDNLDVSTKIGEKDCKVILDKNGIKKEDTTKEEKRYFSLTVDQVYRLAEVGLIVEKALGGPITVEWTYYKDNLYLLNSKPIKFQFEWNKFDLIHEFDTAVMSEKDYSILNTSNNIFSGFSSTLTQSLCVQYLDESLQKLQGIHKETNTSICKILTRFKNVVGSNIFETVLKCVDKDVTEEMKINEITSTGKLSLSSNLHQEAIYRNGIMNYSKTILNICRYLIQCWNSKDYAKEANVLSQAMRVFAENSDSAKVHLKVINRNLHLLKHVIYLNSSISLANNFYQKLLMNLLHDETSSDVTSDEYNEIIDTYNENKLFDIPIKIELMAAVIRSKNLHEEFCKLVPTEGVKWLEEYCPEVIILLKQFMKNYGYRGVQEFDLISNPWEMNTSIIIKILQMSIEKMAIDVVDRRQNSVENNNNTNSKTIKEKMNGKILKWLEKKIQNSFKYKEKSSSAVAIIINKFRFAYLELAKKLVQEGRLPYSELIFHIKHKEVEYLVENFRPDIVAKAVKRSELFPKMQKLDIPENYFGENILFDNYEDSDTDTVTENNNVDNLRIIGHTVHTGHVVAKACVINNIKEISQMKSGDILVTKYLDVGWLPCFPILSGIICETGNLTSLAASAVRKQGMPCVIEAKNATELFKTGDTIMLIGHTGVVERIEKTESD